MLSQAELREIRDLGRELLRPPAVAKVVVNRAKVLEEQPDGNAVEEQVIKTSKQATNLTDRGNSEEYRKFLEDLTDDDLGKYKM